MRSYRWSSREVMVDLLTSLCSYLFSGLSLHTHTFRYHAKTCRQTPHEELQIKPGFDYSGQTPHEEWQIKPGFDYSGQTPHEEWQIKPGFDYSGQTPHEEWQIKPGFDYSGQTPHEEWQIKPGFDYSGQTAHEEWQIKPGFDYSWPPELLHSVQNQFSRLFSAMLADIWLKLGTTFTDQDWFWSRLTYFLCLGNIDWGHFVFFLSICLSVDNFYICYNFQTLKDINFKFACILH